jgi:hypothetical protein
MGWCVPSPVVALITKFTHRPGSTAGFQSEVECGYRIVQDGSKTLLHLETYGSSDRAIPARSASRFGWTETAPSQLRDRLDQASPDLGR